METKATSDRASQAYYGDDLALLVAVRDAIRRRSDGDVERRAADRCIR